MEILNSFLQQINKPDLIQTLNSVINKMGTELNCVRIGIVQEFYPDEQTALVQIASKRVLKTNADGTQTVRDYAPLKAKVCYCCPFITFPLKQGDEVLLLFNDREIESWYINGQANLQKYPRMHDLTDSIAIAGMRSLPNLITILTDCLHLFYGASDVQIKNNQIDITTALLKIIGNTTQTGTITATNLNATAAASDTFESADNKKITVVNGIITSIT